MSSTSFHPATDNRTSYLSTADVVRIVQRQGVAETLHGMLDAIHADYLRWQTFDKHARLGCHSEAGVIELMPVADADDYAFKYVNGHPGNARFGLPTVMAFGAMARMATGLPEFLCELTLTTAIRTAATSALAARALARSDSHSMALIGNGARASSRRWRSTICSASRRSGCSTPMRAPPTS